MVFNKTEEQEKEYLRQIINIINNSVNNTDKSVKEHVDTLQEYKEYLWSNYFSIPSPIPLLIASMEF